MGIFSSIRRYIMTLGGLIEGDIDSQTDAMLTTSSGIKATFKKTRTQWTQQYNEVREAVAQLMMVLEQKRRKVEDLSEEAQKVKTKMQGAVERFRATNDAKYKAAFTELFERDKAITVEQEQVDTEIKDLQAKVEAYKGQLREMQGRIENLKGQEAAAIADIVSSQQIIKLNDRLSDLSTELDDDNLRAIEERRQALLAKSKLSGELSSVEAGPSLDKELLETGMKSEAADVFAALVAEDEKKTASDEEEAAPETEQREL